MTEQPDVSRRRIVQLFAGLPLLPLAGGSAAAALLSACGGGNDSAAPATRLMAVTFTGMAAPTLADPAKMATTTVGSGMNATYSDGKTQPYALAYQTFFITGAQVPNGSGGTTLSGGYYDINNRPIMDNSGSSPRQFFSDCPDGTSLLKLDAPTVAGVKGNTVFAVVQFEYTSANLKGDSMYGMLPSPIAVLTLDQDKTTGALTLVKYHNVDTSAANGLWITCGASRSPWNTHLSSEEYEPDATAIATDSQFAGFSRSLYGDATRANPYHYGHMPEITVNPDGTGSCKKHYCMGRISHELVQVMPDERTALMGDDATNGGLFMFIADKARDLSSGTLYVARWQQTSVANGGAATLQWIKLGQASSAEIKALADTLKAADILDVRTTDPADASFTRIPFSGRSNWIRIKPGMEKAAAFLETHRYAALAGGSMGFTKMEGTTVNTRDKIAYTAISAIGSAMTNGSGGIAIKGPSAGAVYALNLKDGQKDTGGAAIDSAWVPVDMAAVPALLSEDLATPDALGNTANADKVANPDNIKFSEKLRTLFIGEDSGTHVNNFLWGYNVDTKVLTRLLSTPSGAESTGLHAVDDMNGFAYVMSNFQHAGDWSSTLHAKVRTTLDPLIRANYRDRYGAAVGYLTGFPLLG
ncbi:alkaline phosphatase [Duganella sp. Leaf126]|uniref:PhoX family protein n=1 Tax=Duganella sp. Leaf126 TaxID=1736266 RepID=UPI0007001673|nr:alkaline phosphatase PhoX [Duganella sp. Leaf126]KQQ32969.1 alkaline phosphatase [Duganella sp. Leaf126]